MNTTQPILCNCTACPGAACTCGCQQAAEPVAGTCSPQCPCGPDCQCGAQCQCGAGSDSGCAQS